MEKNPSYPLDVLSLNPGFYVLGKKLKITRCQELAKRWKVVFKHKQIQKEDEVLELFNFF
jgi:hypothetical protein